MAYNFIADALRPTAVFPGYARGIHVRADAGVTIRNPNATLNARAC